MAWCRSRSRDASCPAGSADCSGRCGRRLANSRIRACSRPSGIFLAQFPESEEIVDIVEFRIVPDAVLNPKPHEIGCTQLLFDVEGEEDHVLAAVTHQRQTVLGFPSHVIGAHDIPPLQRGPRAMTVRPRLAICR